MISEKDISFIELSIRKAELSVKKGGFPAGSVLVKNDAIIGTGLSVPLSKTDQMSHSDLMVLHENRDKDLTESTLYSSIAPCLMCLMAASWAGVTKIVYACRQEDLKPEYYGTMYPTLISDMELINPILMEHAKEYQDRSFKLVKEWEEKNNLI